MKTVFISEPMRGIEPLQLILQIKALPLRNIGAEGIKTKKNRHLKFKPVILQVIYVDHNIIKF